MLKTILGFCQRCASARGSALVHCNPSRLGMAFLALMTLALHNSAPDSGRVVFRAVFLWLRGTNRQQQWTPSCSSKRSQLPETVVSLCCSELLCQSHCKEARMLATFCSSTWPSEMDCAKHGSLGVKHPTNIPHSFCEPESKTIWCDSFKHFVVSESTVKQ